MADIKNNAELAAGIAQKISSAAADLTLKGTSTQLVACVQVSAEDECNISFREGSAYLVQLQVHIGYLTDYIKQISETLEKADQLSAKSNQGGLWNPDKIFSGK